MYFPSVFSIPVESWHGQPIAGCQSQSGCQELLKLQQFVGTLLKLLQFLHFLFKCAAVSVCADDLSSVCIFLFSSFLILHEMLALKTRQPGQVAVSVCVFCSWSVMGVKRAAGLCVCLTEGGASYTYTCREANSRQGEARRWLHRKSENTILGLWSRQVEVASLKWNVCKWPPTNLAQFSPLTLCFSRL